MMDIKRLAQVAGGGGGKVVIERQMTLPWAAAFRISVRNVTLRLGRAAITAAGVVLGIAFLTTVWTTKIINEGIEASLALRQQQRMAAVQEVAGGGSGTTEGVDSIKLTDPEEKANQEARTSWLVIMSLLVCTVGISNSMLMSVTERFREIGTMKCLGALDMFIVRLFLIESMLIGLLGSLAGVLVGHLVVLLFYSIKAGWDTAAKMNWPSMLGYMGIALAVGTCLTLIAAVGPALRASRMPPAAALQTEI